MGTHRTGSAPQQESLLLRSEPLNFHHSKIPTKYRVARGQGWGVKQQLGSASLLLRPCPSPRGTSVPRLCICGCICHSSPAPPRHVAPAWRSLLRHPLKFDAMPRLSPLRGPSTLEKNKGLGPCLCLEGLSKVVSALLARKSPPRRCRWFFCWRKVLGGAQEHHGAAEQEVKLQILAPFVNSQLEYKMSHNRFCCPQMTWHSLGLCFRILLLPNRGDYPDSAY